MAQTHHFSVKQIVFGCAFLLGCPRETPRPTVEPAGSASAPLVATAAASAAASASAAPGALDAALPNAPRNVVLLTIDSLRADMPWAGYERPIAPNLQKLAERSVQYTRAYALSSYTSMSVGGFLSGHYPSELPRDGYFFGTYGKSIPFFPELLQKAHVRTVGAQAHSYFDGGPKGPGFDRGFDVWKMVPGIKFNNLTDESVTGEKHADLAIQILSDPMLASTPFFAWFHFMDPHDVYQGHDADGIKYGTKQRDRYDAEVTYADKHIGRLLDFVDKQSWGNNTVIIVTADHGEAFGEHNQFMHGFELWEPLIHVPFFFAGANIAPKKIDTPRSAIDLAPTVLEFLGVPASPGFRGHSLVSEIRGTTAPAPRDVICDLPATSDNDKRRVLIRGSKKVILSGEVGYTKAYDIVADPEEKNALPKGEEVDELVAALKAASAKMKELAPTSCKVGCLNGAYNKKK